MSVGPIGSAALALRPVAQPGQAPDPQANKAQANAQADLLQALRGVQMSATAASRLSDGKGVDLYM